MPELLEEAGTVCLTWTHPDFPIPLELRSVQNLLPLLLDTAVMLGGVQGSAQEPPHVRAARSLGFRAFGGLLGLLGATGTGGSGTMPVEKAESDLALL